MGKILVTYFSASGLTKTVAQRLANAVKADIFEILPKTPYTQADLNWQDKNSRSSVEMRDRACRPPLATPVPDLQNYKVIFVGFPVWWYREPSIIDTFMQTASFDGQTVIPFATSGGSGLGEAAENMQSLAPRAVVKSGKLFSPHTTEKELADWAQSIL